MAITLFTPLYSSLIYSILIARIIRQVKEVDLSYGLKADKLRQWTEYAATQKLKIFVRSGRMQSR